MRGEGVDFIDFTRLGFKFEAKPEKSKKSKSWGILNSKRDQEIFWKTCDKKLLLKKCHVRFILHFALAFEGYIWEKAIILL